MKLDKIFVVQLIDIFIDEKFVENWSYNLPRNEPSDSLPMDTSLVIQLLIY